MLLMLMLRRKWLDYRVPCLIPVLSEVFWVIYSDICILYFVTFGHFLMLIFFSAHIFACMSTVHVFSAISVSERAGLELWNAFLFVCWERRDNYHIF